METMLNIEKNEIQKDININNNSNNDEFEGVPIKSSFHFENQQNFIEDYYKNNFPDFKLFKFHNILICKMGNMLTFNFDKKTFTPKFSIGPHWYLTLVLHFLVLIMALVLYFTIFKRTSTIQITIFIFFIILIIFIIDRTALINPGIVLNKVKGKNDYGFCSICKVYYNPYDRVEHCDLCGVCIDKMDHHCIWVGKCVGRKNIISFYLMIIIVGIFYFYMIICLFLLYFENKKKKAHSH